MFLDKKIRYKSQNILIILKKIWKSVQIRIETIVILIVQLQSHIVILKRYIIYYIKFFIIIKEY